MSPATAARRLNVVQSPLEQAVSATDLSSPVLMRVFNELAPEKLDTHARKETAMALVLDLASAFSKLNTSVQKSAGGRRVAHELSVYFGGLLSGADFHSTKGRADINARLTDQTRKSGLDVFAAARARCVRGGNPTPSTL